MEMLKDDVRASERKTDKPLGGGLRASQGCGEEVTGSTIA